MYTQTSLYATLVQNYQTQFHVPPLVAEMLRFLNKYPKPGVHNSIVTVAGLLPTSLLAVKGPFTSFFFSPPDPAAPSPSV